MSSPAEAVLTERNRSYGLAALFLVLTAALSLVWSHNRLMWNDEFLSFYGDSAPSVAAVVGVQLHYPISLDPPAYHVLSHLSMDLIGRNAMALRLPALAGFLLLQISLFFFVKRLAGSRAAVVALALPLLTASFRYSVEGRPYGLLLGLYALALVCWQDAGRMNAGRRRILPLTGLTVAIALAISSHYFGVLILVPVCMGELARSIERRRLDFGVLLALALGVMSIGLILPFRKALMVYRQHYYITGVNWHDITQGYRELFVNYTTWPMPLQKAAAGALALATIALAVAGYRRFKRRKPAEPACEWVALIGMALLPFFGYLFGRFVTHTMEVRYVIAALIAFAATWAIVLEAKLRRDSFYYAMLAVILVAALVLNGTHIAQERRDTRTMLASFQMSPTAADALRKDPTKRVYIQSLSDFFLNTYYVPQADLRSRFSLVYGQAEEIRWLAHDTRYVTAINMQHLAPLSVTSYQSLLQERDPLVLLYDSSWEWMDKDIAAKQLPVTFYGDCMRGKLGRVGTVPGSAAGSVRINRPQ